MRRVLSQACTPLRSPPAELWRHLGAATEIVQLIRSQLRQRHALETWRHGSLKSLPLRYGIRLATRRDHQINANSPGSAVIDFGSRDESSVVVWDANPKIHGLARVHRIRKRVLALVVRLAFN